jgi:hypothetical protein
MAIVYIHRRKDIEDPFLNVFYVGIGKSRKRAIRKDTRSNHWNNIVNKYGYDIEITHTNVCWEEACAIEKYLISFYGRHDLNNGNLCNHTDGGEGAKGAKRSLETIEKLRIINTGKKLTQEHKNKIGIHFKGKKNPMYGVRLTGENNPMYGKRGYLCPNARKVAQYDIDTKELIAIYETVTEASLKTGIDRRRISDYCNKRRNKRPFKKRLYIWEHL